MADRKEQQQEYKRIIDEILTEINDDDALEYLYDKIKAKTAYRRLGYKNLDELVEEVYREERIKAGLTTENIPFQFFCPQGNKHKLRKMSAQKGYNQQYYCEDCKRKYSVTSTSIVDSMSFDIYKWVHFIESSFDGDPVKTTARRVGIAEKTAVRWRKCLLYAVDMLVAETKLSGVIEVDETMIRTSYRRPGEIEKHDVKRKAHQRGNDTRMKDTQKESVCILCAVDNRGNYIARVCGIGASNSEVICDQLKDRIDYRNVEMLLTDGGYALRKFAGIYHLSHLRLIPRDIPGCGKVPTVKNIGGRLYHIQHINAFHSSIKKFLRNGSPNLMSVVSYIKEEVPIEVKNEDVIP